jgi:hypothetical protein
MCFSDQGDGVLGGSANVCRRVAIQEHRQRLSSMLPTSARMNNPAKVLWQCYFSNWMQCPLSFDN